MGTKITAYLFRVRDMQATFWGIHVVFTYALGLALYLLVRTRVLGSYSAIEI